MRSPLSYHLTIWPLALLAFLLGIGYASKYVLLFGLMQIGLFYFATRTLFRWEMQTNSTSVIAWLSLASISILTLCWSFFCWLIT